MENKLGGHEQILFSAYYSLFVSFAVGVVLKTYD
jgi:hypothetical protein